MGWRKKEYNDEMDASKRDRATRSEYYDKTVLSGTDVERCSCWTTRGAKHEHKGMSNEDRIFASTNVYRDVFNSTEEERSGPQLTLFGVFDGHGGGGCAEFVRNNVLMAFYKSIPTVQRYPQTKDRLAKALDETVLTLEESWKVLAGANHDTSGACVLLAAQTEDTLVVASLGDSRAIFFSDSMGSLSLCADHKVSNVDEQRHIIAHGGSIENKRVCGCLEPTRTIGDMDVKLQFPGVIRVKPFIWVFDLPNNDPEARDSPCVSPDSSIATINLAAPTSPKPVPVPPVPLANQGMAADGASVTAANDERDVISFSETSDAPTVAPIAETRVMESTTAVTAREQQQQQQQQQERQPNSSKNEAEKKKTKGKSLWRKLTSSCSAPSEDDVWLSDGPPPPPPLLAKESSTVSAKSVGSATGRTKSREKEALDSYLLLASDGVLETMSTAQIIKEVSGSVVKHRKRHKRNLARDLVNRCIRGGARDDVSAVVVVFGHRRPDKSTFVPVQWD